MKNHQTGVRIARRLHETEHAVDKAMLETTLLLNAMIQGRIDQGLAAQVGQPEIESVVASLSGLTSARRGLVTSHTGLAVIAEQAGLGWRMDGPLERKIEPTASMPKDAAA